MRDSTIINQLDNLAAAMGTDNANLQTSVIMVRTRIDAIELTLFNSRFGILKMILMQLFSPRRVALKMRDAHKEQIRRFNAARQEAQKARPIIKPAPPVGVIKVES